MRFILRKFFQEIIAYEPDATDLTWKVDMEVKKLLEKYLSDTNNQSEKELRNMMYRIASVAEEEAFLLGMKYMLRLLLSLLSN